MSHASRRGRDEEEEGECCFYDALPDLKDDADSHLQPQQPEEQQGAGRDGPSSRSGTPLKQGRPHGDGGDDQEEEEDRDEADTLPPPTPSAHRRRSKDEEEEEGGGHDWRSEVEEARAVLVSAAQDPLVPPGLIPTRTSPTRVGRAVH